MQRCPKIKIKKKPLDWCLEAANLLILLAHWIVVLFISSHILILLPIFSTVVYAGITVSQRFPHLYNYASAEVTEQNAEKLYQMGIRFISISKLLTILFFTITSMQISHYVKFNDLAVIGIYMVIMLIIIIYVNVKISKIK